MKLEHLLFLMIATAAGGAACSVAESSSSTGSFGGGGGGDFDGQTGTGPPATSGSTDSAPSATGVGAGGVGGGGGGGGFPANCADTTECGNFGGGCVKCASKSSCAAEYQACFGDLPCKSYSFCVTSCAAKDLDCLQVCENQFPSGAAEYQALTRCVICGDCVALCEHAPDICK
jgi:hypothetical protein